MRPYLYLLLLLCTYACSNACAQEQKPMLRSAEEHLIRHEYAAAAPLYEDAAKRKPDITILRKLAYCYGAVNNYEQAAATGKRIINMPQANAQDLIVYADMLKCLARYDEAKAVYLKAGSDTSTKVKERIAGCDSAVVWKQRQPAYALQNYEILNTALSDWGASYYPGNNVVFSSTYDRREVMDTKAKLVSYDDKRTLEPFLKIYVLDSIRHDFIRGFAAVFDQYKFHTGPIAFSSDYTTAYFTVTNVESIPYEKTDTKPTMKMGDRRLQLFIAKKVSGTWQKPIAFTYNKPEAYSVGHAALNKAGNVLYFASDMPGGYGQTDLWYCELQPDSTWGVPHNCGAAINTDEQDDFPTVNDEQGLYFSSKGHVGMGGLDVFYAKGEKNNWTAALNMQSPINSEGDDFYYAERAPGQGLLSSNRSGGKGSDDIYKCTSIKPKPSIVILQKMKYLILQTTVLDEQQNTIQDASVWLDNMGTNDTWLQHTDARGNTYQAIDFTDKYKVIATKLGYSKVSQEVNTDSSSQTDTVKVVLQLAKPVAKIQWNGEDLQKGKTFVLKNIYYDFDKWDIREDARPELNKVVELLKEHPSMKIELSSHTDCRGADDYNMRLSQRRAESAVNYIINKGIDANRIHAKGYGRTRLVNNCDCTQGHECTKAEHQQNRRTDITVLEY